MMNELDVHHIIASVVTIPDSGRLQAGVAYVDAGAC